MLKLFRNLTKFETGLWLSSVIVITASFIISQGGDALTLIASLIGVTALIFVAKGYVFGQILVVVFSLFYGVISFFFHYCHPSIPYWSTFSAVSSSTGTITSSFSQPPFMAA